MKNRVCLLHPFSAQAIGLKESDLFYSHSKPHENALSYLSNLGYFVNITYFTGNPWPYTKTVNGIQKQFFPLTSPLFNRHRWRKQGSHFHYIYTIFFAPDLTIINMSGHGSPYIFKLGHLLNKKGKAYVAMIGGMNMSVHQQSVTYYKNAFCIVVHTKVQKRALQQLDDFKNLDIRVIPLGVDTNMFKPSNIKPKSFELLYVGRVTRLKQIEKAIEALDYIKNSKGLDCHLTILGPKSDALYYQELQELVLVKHLDNCVTFKDAIDQQDLIPYYQKAHLLLLPSKHESFGMVMVEAMACGTPVAALKGSGGGDEIIADGFNGVLSNADDYAKTVTNTLTSGLLQELSLQARSDAISHWSLEYTNKCFRSLVESVFLRA